MLLHYLHLDVFTANRLEGNQLAVFTEPPDLPAPLMQRIAAEMNFSESTFIYPPAGGGDVRMRIFTPARELPMAGHPTIGSTFALAATGFVPRGREQLVFELGVGPTPVSLEWDEDGLRFAWMTQSLPAFGRTIGARQALAASLGLAPSDLVPKLPLQSVSCGVPFLFVPLLTRTAVDAAAVDRRAYEGCLVGAGLELLPVFIFTTEPGADDATVYSRMLAPGFGIGEDPATGSASGPLGCYLLHHGVVGDSEARRILSAQGVAMGRPSRIHVAIDSEAGAISRVRVGGQAVTVGRGEIEL